MQTKLISNLSSQAKKEGINRFVVGAVLARQNKVLFLKRSADDFMPGIYELPSGKVEEGESLDEALIREVKEETGMNITKIRGYLNSFDYTSRSGNKTRQFNFVCDYQPGDFVKLNDKEHEGYVWLSSHQMSSYNITDETKKSATSYFLTTKLDCDLENLLEDAQTCGVERIVVGAVITNSEKVLILKRSSSDFMGGIDELPSGKLEKGESIALGLFREVKEETGLVTTSINSYLGHFDYRSKSNSLTRQLNFSVTAKDSLDIKLSSEHEGYAWISAQEIDRYKLTESVKVCLGKHFSVLSSTSSNTSNKQDNVSFFPSLKRKAENQNPELNPSDKEDRESVGRSSKKLKT